MSSVENRQRGNVLSSNPLTPCTPSHHITIIRRLITFNIDHYGIYSNFTGDTLSRDTLTRELLSCPIFPQAGPSRSFTKSSLPAAAMDNDALMGGFRRCIEFCIDGAD
jgi:hypothetical protein